MLVTIKTVFMHENNSYSARHLLFNQAVMPPHFISFQHLKGNLRYFLIVVEDRLLELTLDKFKKYTSSLSIHKSQFNL